MTATLGSIARPVPSFRQLCVVAHHAFDELGDDADIAEVLDAVKWACARARFTYAGTGDLARAVDAVHVARAKGYRTPQRQGISRRSGPNVWIAPPPFTRDELARAESWRRNVGQVRGCQHSPTCADWQGCRARLIRGWRRRARRSM